MKRFAGLLPPALLAAACAFAQAPPASAPPPGRDPQILSTLLQLLELKDKTRPSQEDFTQSALKDLLVLGTPAGFHLRNRYLHLGVSLSQALSVTDDARLKEQLIELARWERSPEIRSVALIALAGRREAPHLAYFREALLNPQTEIRFASLEALELWNLPEAKQEFVKAARNDNSPVVRVYAAQALARRGDPLGRETLLAQLESGDWVARGMAARYLGDLGAGEDYDALLNRMTLEASNDFVTAECAIAALKLFPKNAKSAHARPAPAPPAGPPASPGSSAAAPAGLYVQELEPLVITAPRLKIPATALVDGRINAALLRLLEDKADARPTEEQLQDPSLRVLNALSSPVGFQLKTRYTELGFLLTEGLAGTSDLNLRERVRKVAQSGSNPQVRAAALVALAYNQEFGDRGLFQEALLSRDITVRFGALEALQAWARPDAATEIGNAARLDGSPVARVYGAAALLRLGDPAGRDILLRSSDHQDWLVRAMADRYLGELGDAGDFDRILLNLSRETNNFVRAEMCGALLRLQAKRGG